jgi:RNase P/RNase MRP subunit POP5
MAMLFSLDQKQQQQQQQQRQLASPIENVSCSIVVVVFSVSLSTGFLRADRRRRRYVLFSLSRISIYQNKYICIANCRFDGIESAVRLNFRFEEHDD